MKLSTIIIGGVVLGGAVLLASALSQPQWPKLQIFKSGGEWGWRLVDANGDTVTEPARRFATEAEARADFAAQASADKD